MIGQLLLCWLALQSGSSNPLTQGRLEASHFEFRFSPELRGVAEELAAVADEYRAQVIASLGTAGPDRIIVLIAAGLPEMQRLAPSQVHVPPWAAGMAFWRSATILLRARPQPGRRSDLRLVFLHELAHLALNQAIGGHPVPRWFHEGFAIYQSGEWSTGRVLTLAHGVLADRLFSLLALTDSFPEKPPDVDLAYAQSIDFVAYLLGRYGRDRFHHLIRLVSRGWTFLNAVEEATDSSILRIEQDWHADLKMRFTWIPLLTGATTVWFLATLLLVAAYLRKRHTRRLGLALLEDENQDPPPPPLSASTP